MKVFFGKGVIKFDLTVVTDDMRGFVGAVDSNFTGGDKYGEEEKSVSLCSHLKV